MANEERKGFADYAAEEGLGEHATMERCLEIPVGLSDLQELTWTIAAALNRYDRSIEAHGDDAVIIDFINSMGVDTPM